MVHRCWLLFCVAELSACLSASDPASLAVRWPQRVGSAQQLTRDDIWQIIQLARQQPWAKLPVTQLDGYRSDRIRVKSGAPQKSGDVMTEFEVRKQNGRWLIVEGTINTGPAIITE